jgi:NAD(P)-dependent dehydrogenase (short-subunit alcohol dehydrogenase family)
MSGRSSKPVAIVTGASSGIGHAAAQRFIKEGYTVYGLNRGQGPGADVVYLSVDVTDAARVKEAIDEIWAREGRIDVLVNNAGFGISGAVEFTGLEDAKRQLDVNFFGAFTCTQAVLPYMREQGSGCIISVSSVAAVVAIPYQAFYSAAKSALNALTMALANEVRGQNIKVTALMPSDVKTGFTAARKKNEEGLSAYPNLQSSVATMERDEQHGMKPENIARLIVRIAKKRHPKPLYASCPKDSVLVLLARYLPPRLVNWVVWQLYH